MSDQIERRLLEVLRLAIEDERRAQKRYKKGLLLSHDQEMRDMFKYLLAEECEHERRLLERYRDIKKRLGLKIFERDEEEGVTAAKV